MGPSGLSERALVALRTSKLSKNCASRGLVDPFRRAQRAEKGPPGLQGGGGRPPPPPPPLATCLVTSNYNYPVPRNTQHNRSRRNSAFTDAQTRLAHSAHRWQQNRQKFLWDRLQIDARSERVTGIFSKMAAPMEEVW